MNFNIKRVEIITTVPLEIVEDVRKAMCDAGGGVIGNYNNCSMSTKCVGTFEPNEDANPYIGKKNKLEYVQEEKLEVICDIENVKKVITKLREIHPYEEPAINIIPLLEEDDFE